MVRDPIGITILCLIAFLQKIISPGPHSFTGPAGLTGSWGALHFIARERSRVSRSAIDQKEGVFMKIRNPQDKPETRSNPPRAKPGTGSTVGGIPGRAFPDVTKPRGA